MAAVEMDAIADSMLLHGHARRQARAGERPARKVFLLRDPLVDADSIMRRPQPLGAKRQDRADPLIHSQAEHLDRKDVVEPVDDQAGETIPLGVDDAIGVGLALEVEDRRSQRDRVVDAAAPEFRSGRRALPRQEPQTDLRPAVPESVAEVHAVAVDHAHQVAVVGRGRPDGPVEHLAIDELMGPRGADRHGRQRFFRRQAPVGHSRGSVDRLGEDSSGVPCRI